MKKILLFAALSSFGSSLLAQSEHSAFTSTGRAGAATTFATDYHALGINPANLGWPNEYEKTATLGFLEFSASAFSDAITKPELRESILNFGSGNFTYEDKKQAAAAFDGARLAMNLDMMYVGFAVGNETVGNFGFSVRERLQWFSRFGTQVSDIMFLGYNASYFDIKQNNAGQVIPDTLPDSTALGIASNPSFYSEILQGSQFTLSWYREYNLGYGRKLFGDHEEVAIYAGVGLKYLTGFGIMDVREENGEFTAFAALSPLFDIDYGTAQDQHPAADTSNNGFFPDPVGKGFGWDVGITMVAGERFKIGFAVTDIGSITWNTNVYSAIDDTLSSLQSGGFNSYNIFKEAEQIVGEFGVFKWNGEVEKKVKLPTTVRVGMSYEFVQDKLEAGVDFIIPGNDVAGNYDKPLFALGLDVKPVKFLKLSTGITGGGNYGFNMPIGITFIVGEGTWEVGFASRDAITFLTQNGPTLSASLGFLRFRF